MALAQYGLAPTCRFIGHSENITFEVTDDRAGKYLLRLHEPITAHFAGVRQQPAAIESELEWLEALGRDTRITLPRPARNRAGHLVTLITLPGAMTIPCTLLHWVEGEHIRMDAPEAGVQVEWLGMLQAELHAHTSTWQIPNNFVRPAYGSTFFSQVLDQLAAGVPAGALRERDYALIRESILRAAEQLGTLAPDHEHWGLIHNDLHPGNCLVCGDTICPIDFSLCGFGYYLFDIGTSLGSIPQVMRPAFLDGYTHRRSLQGDPIALIEGCLIISRMSYYALVLPDPSHHEWVKSRIPQVVDTICARFLNGQSFLFDIR